MGDSSIESSERIKSSPPQFNRDGTLAQEGKETSPNGRVTFALVWRTRRAPKRLLSLSWNLNVLDGISNIKRLPKVRNGNGPNQAPCTNRSTNNPSAKMSSENPTIQLNGTATLNGTSISITLFKTTTNISGELLKPTD